jgi:hypothetical protein
MPESRKRKKKPSESVESTAKKTQNIVKRPIGKAVIILLSFGFILSVVLLLIITLVEVMNA